MLLFSIIAAQALMHGKISSYLFEKNVVVLLFVTGRKIALHFFDFLFQLVKLF